MSAEKVLRQVAELQRRRDLHVSLANLDSLLELKRAAVEWATDATRGEEFQRKQDRLIELALVVMEGIE